MTEFRAEFRTHELVVLRAHSRFECWIERKGSDTKITHTRGLRSLDDAKKHVLESAVLILNGRALSDEEYDAIRLPLLMDLAETHETAARRMAEAGLYGEELSLRLQAEKYRAEAEGIRRSVERRLAAQQQAAGR